MSKRVFSRTKVAQREGVASNANGPISVEIGPCSLSDQLQNDRSLPTAP